MVKVVWAEETSQQVVAKGYVSDRAHLYQHWGMGLEREDGKRDI